MRVRRLINNDWSFGRGQSNYADGNEAILQNVATRLKSFKNDWLLDGDKNIDWLVILGQKENEDLIINEVERVTLATEGVVKIISIEVVKSDNRKANINIVLSTIFDEVNKLGIEL